MWSPNGRGCNGGGFTWPSAHFLPDFSSLGFSPAATASSPTFPFFFHPSSIKASTAVGTGLGPTFSLGNSIRRPCCCYWPAKAANADAIPAIYLSPAPLQLQQPSQTPPQACPLSNSSSPRSHGRPLHQPLHMSSCWGLRHRAQQWQREERYFCHLVSIEWGLMDGRFVSPRPHGLLAAGHTIATGFKSCHSRQLLLNIKFLTSPI